MSNPAEPTAELSPKALPDPSEVRIWGTKGIHFWALLGAVLVKARPTSLLEFGSGRSTTFLADYAFRQRARLVSIEQSDVWHQKVAADIKFMAVKGDYVHHVPLVGPTVEPQWYDHEKVKELLGPRAFDLVFIDGPTGGSRKNKAGKALIAQAAREARLILVDDVHRGYNDRFFQELAKRFPRDGVFYYRYGKNLVAIAVDEWRPIVRSAFEFLELDYTNVLPEEAGSDDKEQNGAG